MWPFKNHVEPEQKPKPEPEPKQAPDDWEPRQSEWLIRYVCHCGAYYIEGHLPTEICPKCGCPSDGLVKTVGRMEWEKSPYRSAQSIGDFFCYPLSAPWRQGGCRNAHFVPKPDGCQAPKPEV